MSHRGIARLSDKEAEAEIADSIDAVAAITGRRPKELCLSLWRRALVAPRERQTLKRHGIDIAVTTRPGTLPRDVG